MLKILHNPRCRISRKALEYLKKKTSDFEIIDYLKEGLPICLLKEILLKSNLQPDQLARPQEELFKKELKGKNFSPEEWVQILHENPILLKRPVVISKHKAVLAQPPENMDSLLK